MKKVFIFLTISIFLFSCVNQQGTHDQSKDQLMESVSAFNKAFKDADLSLLDSMTTDNYLHSNGNSRAIGKKDWLSYMTGRKASLEVGDLKVDDYTMSEIRVEMHSNTAILTAKISVSGIKDGQSFDNAYRVSNLWVYENNTWKRAGFHDGKIK